MAFLTRVFIHVAIVVLAILGTSFVAGSAYAQTLKTTRNKAFNKPVYFDPSEEEVLSRPQIAYKLTPEIPGQLVMGPVAISEKTFFFEYKTASQLVGSGPKGSKILFMAWPKDLFTQGKVEIISSGGRVVWQQDFSSRSFDEFQIWLEQNNYKNKNTLPQMAQHLSRIRLKVENFDKEEFWKENPAFRICISQTKKQHFSRLCSRTLRTRMTPEGVVLGKLQPDGQVRLLLNNQPVENEGALDVEFNKDVSFYARIPSGETYEFYSQPASIDLADFAYNPQTNLVELVGYDYFPFTKYSLVNQKVYSDFIESIGFEQTIGDQRRFWKVLLKKNDQRIYFPGSAGGVFGYLLNVDAFPKYQARPHLSTRTRMGTYKSSTRLFGRKQPASTVSSSQNSVEMSKEDNTKFDWYFKAEEPAKFNRSELNITYEGKTYKSYYEMYRGYANELSARLTGVPSTSIVFMAEGAYNLWFEDFLWLSGQEWAKQRFGVSTKYFKTLTPFSAKSSTGALIDTQLSATTVDFKYRFNPGLWTRDETMGAMLSYQSAVYNDASGTMAGAGWFWARSMPRIMDDFINLFPFMSYPKWVDMELIYYPMAVSSDTLLYSNLALNFHGQVLWRPNFFGEAGFGIKRFGFGSKVGNTRAELNVIYGTIGIGYKF